MNKKQDLNDAKSIAAKIDTEIRALPILNTPSGRAIRRTYSQKLSHAAPAFILNLARILIKKYKHRWLAYELIRSHKAAFQSIGKVELEEFGQGINSWWSVDSFARTLAGPAWLNGQISDRVIHTWARSRDRWWRRAALVSTVALNVRSRGGYGDVPRTLAVCRLLVDDHDDMVAKALSWALRDLVVHDARSVRTFLKKYDTILAARVKREVMSKLKTGLKSPPTKKR
jgi:3-methyladenine DNA glycosylase AlkD